MSLIKLLATLGLLLSREAAAEEPAERPVSVRVPFGCGLSFEVSQAHNTGSHLHNDTYAWDFRMPVGVPIVSARNGVVRMARGDSTIGGCDPKYAKHANYVVVDHGDGTESQYLHFSSVVVQAGQKVREGELLGYSGKTGWACGSHLHFKVARQVHNGWNNPSIPAVIEGFGDPGVRTVLTAASCGGNAPAEVIHASAEEPTPAISPADAPTGSAADQAVHAHALGDDVRPAVQQASGAAENPVTSPTSPEYTVGGNAAR